MLLVQPAKTSWTGSVHFSSSHLVEIGHLYMGMKTHEESRDWAKRLVDHSPALRFLPPSRSTTALYVTCCPAYLAGELNVGSAEIGSQLRWRALAGMARNLRALGVGRDWFVKVLSTSFNNQRKFSVQNFRVTDIQQLFNHHSSYTTHHTPLIIHYSSHTTHHTLLIIHHSSHTTHHTPLITHH